MQIPGEQNLNLCLFQGFSSPLIFERNPQPFSQEPHGAPDPRASQGEVARGASGERLMETPILLEELCSPPSRKLAPWSSALRKQAVLKLVKHTQLSLDGALGKG